MTHTTRFATWLIAQRKARGWNQTDVARYLGVHQTVVGRWENAEILPRLPRFRLIVRLFGVDANEILPLIPTEDEDATAA